MPLLTPLITHRPNAQQLYASAGSGGGAGVTSLNALSGGLSLTSVDNSVTIVPSGSTIDLSAVGGATGNPAPKFTATGTGASGGFVSTGSGANVYLNNGSFVSSVDTEMIEGGAGILVFQNATEPPLTRWEVGYADGSETGVGNAGADFAINNYADDGSPLGTPLSINRATGVVTATGLIPASLPFTSQSTQQQGAVAVGQNSIAMVASTYTAPRSGLYLFSASFVCNVAESVLGFCSIGEYDDVGITLFNIPTATSYTVNLKPWSMPNTDAVPAGVDYNLTNTQVVSLVEGTAYTLSAFTLNCSTPNIMVFPSFGGPGGSGCRFVANIVPLC